MENNHEDFHKKYIKSKKFKYVKDKVFERDGHSCVVCGRKENLVCHHKHYKYLGQANSDEIASCVTLCQSDHLAIHSRNPNKYWYSQKHPRNRNDLSEIQIDGFTLLIGKNGEEFFDGITYKKYKIYSNKRRGNRKTIQLGNQQYFCSRLVANAFPEICGTWFEGCEVHHINQNPEDNRAENLKILSKEEHREIHKDFISTWAKDNLSITTYQYDLDGNFITSFNSSIEASEKTGINAASIRNCLTGISKSAGGYLWSQTFSEKIKPIKEDIKIKKPIVQYTKDGKFIRVWDGIVDASSSFGNPNSSNIGNCLRGKAKTAFGYKWAYK